MLKLKLQFFGYLIRRTDSLEKALKLGNLESKRKMGWERMRWLCSITKSMDMVFSKLWERVEDRGVLGGSKITADGDCSHEIKDTCSLEEKL